ncbi:hypothetical protein [Nitrosomonas ureae]|nr:hypothetical protein [Nitrosomonas ureae]
MNSSEILTLLLLGKVTYPQRKSGLRIDRIIYPFQTDLQADS